MFAGNVMLMPGQELRRFDVLRPKMRENEHGREIINGYVLLGFIQAVLAHARPDEIDRWKQLNHPVTHKVIMRHKPIFDVKPGDIFEIAGRRLYVQTMPYDPGGLLHYTIFYCGERNDTGCSIQTE